VYKVPSTENCSGGDTEKPAAVAVAVNQNSPSKNLMSSFRSLIYPVVNKEVEQQFSGKGVTL
jgi:hypothetical protein